MRLIPIPVWHPCLPTTRHVTVLGIRFYGVFIWLGKGMLTDSSILGGCEKSFMTLVQYYSPKVTQRWFIQRSSVS